MDAAFHLTVVVTILAATLATGMASAAVLEGHHAPIGIKGDRLPVTANAREDYFTVETRRTGGSVLCRLPIELNDWYISHPRGCD
jgi:hypothetical protein